jgi:hypothetical protein
MPRFQIDGVSSASSDNKCLDFSLQPIYSTLLRTREGPCNIIAYICSSTPGLYTTLSRRLIAPECLFTSSMPGQTPDQGQSPVDVSIATEPNNLEAVPTLLKEITESFDAFITSNVGRTDLLAKCRTLVQSLETPRETMIYHCWAQVRTTHSVLGRSNWINYQIDWCNGRPQFRC